VAPAEARPLAPNPAPGDRGTTLAVHGRMIGRTWPLPLLSPPAPDPFDLESFDFVAYVARCHGLEQADAESIVRRWVKQYEPSPAARRALGSDPPKSGVRSSIPNAGEFRTGTDG
jgi:hypothetical protein